MPDSNRLAVSVIAMLLRDGTSWAGHSSTLDLQVLASTHYWYSPYATSAEGMTKKSIKSRPSDDIRSLCSVQGRAPCKRLLYQKHHLRATAVNLAVIATSPCTEYVTSTERDVHQT